MELYVILLLILQSMSVSLGVGCSTLAICNFFVAIADGKIDEGERRMMGIVYIALRVAMVLILITTGILTSINYGAGTFVWTPFFVSIWTLITVLYVNALLMTLHVMPSTVGPALQASTWYTLGVTMTLFSLGMSNYKLLHFYLGYVAAFLLAVAVVNGIMAILKHRKSSN